MQLGSFQEMVCQRDIKNKISFNYTWPLKNELRVRDSVSGQSFSADQVKFDARAGMQNDERRALFLENLHYQLIHKTNPSLSIGMTKRSGKKSEYKVGAEAYKLVRNQGRVWNPGAPVRFYGFPDQVVAYYQNAEFVQKLNLIHEDLFRSVYYLGPLRTKTERLYSWTGTEPEGVGYDGENTIAALLAAKNRKISLGYKKVNKPFEQVIATKLKNMGLIDAFRMQRLSEKRQEYEVNIRTKGSKDWVDLPDVGFGISQVLPVLVQCFYAPHNSIIIMEQPEIHLHPRAQAELADVMIDVIKSRENNADRNIQLIIETHSEHFLRRLQRRIAEDTISAKDISAYFAKVDRTPAKLEPLEIDIFGNIKNWPENFFGDEMDDITGQATAAMKKRIEQEKKQEETNE
ncbi:AAA family ATPase [Desulfonema ishimotonii]|uniref:AAA family ATPase n=1 Tax=Desulfonema ishimotonii TaxID=45657 RepID=UPI001E45868E|nr:DUF3696 domain-containing protein [Desulfonema ishimotonii]